MQENSKSLRCKITAQAFLALLSFPSANPYAEEINPSWEG
jgi:hypothetical protein